MVINMFVAATAGTLIPLALRALKVDPALASSVFITTLTDVFGFLSFLGLAHGVHQVPARCRVDRIEHRRCRMPVYTSEALILRTYKLGEADRIVVFLTRDRGKKRGVAKGARRAEVAVTGALEPMTRAGVAYYEREQRDLVRLNYVEPQRSRRCRRAARGGRVGARARRVLRRADRRVGARGARRRAAVPARVVGRRRARRRARRSSALARYFEYWLLRLQGVYPALSACPACGGGRSSGGAMMPPRDTMLRVPRAARRRAGTALSRRR